jgi:CubicO group peptidase (beta-lactamase class C family)
MSVEIHGFCEERFAAVRDAFLQNFNAGLEVGASVAVTWRGETVVDLWAGDSDAETGRPWEKDSLVFVASTTKIPLILCTLMVIDRGLLDLDTPVAHYWPEFAQGGKGHVTIRDALTHQAGVPNWAPPPPPEFLHDWPALVARLAAEPHWFEGKRRVVYHGLTYGPLLGELIRRVDGRGPRRFYIEEVQTRCGADFHMGLVEQADLGRVAKIKQPPSSPPRATPPPPDDLLVRMTGPPFAGPPPDFQSWDFLSAEYPAGIGLANGRSIARVCAILAGGGEFDGVRYLSRAMVEEASREQARDRCPYLGKISMGLGFGLWSDAFQAVAPTTFHWGGAGGSWGAMDTAASFSLGYAPNHFLPDVVGGVGRQQPFFRALASLYPMMCEGAA